MNTDSPITHPTQDKFGYAPLAEHVAPVLILDSNSPSIVAGVEARWGSGKTSFLNLTRRALAKDGNDVLIFEYRPWLYSTVDSLLLGFCVQIAAQLQGNAGKKYQNASKALMGLSGVFGRLASLPGEYGLTAAAGAAGSQLLAGAADAMQDLTKIDLSNARDKVQHALDQAGRPVVIIIDDVDRLEPNEIRLLFQFLKAVADFRGVSYLLAYDPTPVEKALSFGGELSGREYLKKFVQLPIRLPRISNLLLQRFFREAVNDLSRSVKPVLTAPEQSALENCSQLAVFLQCLKTPRDVVRLLNSFRLRLEDCRGEINLDQLLLFVLLDLVSPEGVELVREHPELFLLPLAHHPEFEIVEADSAISRLLSEEKDKTKEKDRLFSMLDEDERAITQKLISDLFGNARRSEGSYDVRRAQTAHGLIKLLYGGATSLSFSAKDAVSFLQGKKRAEILKDIVSSGALKQWIYFLSSITDTAEIKNAAGIATSLITAVKEEPTNTFESVHRLVAEYLVEVFQKVLTQRGRLRLTKTIAAQRKKLFIAEHFLVKLASNAGLWKNGQSFSVKNRQSPHEPDTVPPESIVDAEKRWLNNVRSAAANGSLHKHPHLGSILHRWGQFSDNDYTEVQGYLSAFSTTNDPLLILSHCALGVSLDGLDKIVSDPGSVKTALLRYQTCQELRVTAVKVMDHLQNLSVQRETLASGQSA
jgi:predicted KAP-like P-loop ATPase